jgi:hypothetical protein
VFPREKMGWGKDVSLKRIRGWGEDVAWGWRWVRDDSSWRRWGWKENGFKGWSYFRDRVIFRSRGEGFGMMGCRWEKNCFWKTQGEVKFQRTNQMKWWVSFERWAVQLNLVKTKGGLVNGEIWVIKVQNLDRKDIL